ncbi:CBS domain-containing protein [Streptomyces sp. NPDC004787]|uniref:CBS domain-containing protein n=1 Tax=Streptomyces sp. NPDC004787 TaxID=3154291 RepID=UPI0033A7357B
MTPTQPQPPPSPVSAAAEPHVWAEMTVEVALAVMSGARTARLVIRDGDGRRTGVVTRDQLAGFRASPAYTDQVRLSELHQPDTPHRSGPPRPSPCEVPCAA